MKTIIICHNPYITKYYEVDRPINEIENSLDNISHGYEETLSFRNAIDTNENKNISLLLISPKNWASIELSEID